MSYTVLNAARELKIDELDAVSCGDASSVLKVVAGGALGGISSVLLAGVIKFTIGGKNNTPPE